MRRLASALLLLATACSTPQIAVRVDEAPVAPGKDEARVVVYRPSHRNERKAYAVFDDEELVGFAQSGAWFEARCAPGDHFFYLRGAGDHAVRATLAAGKTYFLKVDSTPRWFRLELRLVPVVPGSEEFESVDAVLEGLVRREAVAPAAEEYEDRFADAIADRLAYYRNEGRDECAELKAGDGR